MRRVVNECHSISVMTANREGGSAGFVGAADGLACFDRAADGSASFVVPADGFVGFDGAADGSAYFDRVADGKLWRKLALPR